MLYEDKEIGTIEKAVRDYLENYRKRTGNEPNVEKIKSMFEQVAEQKEKEIFLNCFETYTPSSLRIAAQICTKIK